MDEYNKNGDSNSHKNSTPITVKQIDESIFGILFFLILIPRIYLSWDNISGLPLPSLLSEFVGLFGESIGTWLGIAGIYYVVVRIKNKKNSEKTKNIRIVIGVILCLSMIFGSLQKNGIKDGSNNIRSSNTQRNITKVSEANLENEVVLQNNNITPKRYFADPNITIQVTGLMMKEARGLKELQDLILTNECLAYSKLFDSQAKRLNMGDGTILTRVNPINLYDYESYKNNGPLYDEVITESAGNCVRSLINGGLLNPGSKGDKKLIETLKYMEL